MSTDAFLRDVQLRPPVGLPARWPYEAPKLALGQGNSALERNGAGYGSQTAPVFGGELSTVTTSGRTTSSSRGPTTAGR